MHFLSKLTEGVRKRAAEAVARELINDANPAITAALVAAGYKIVPRESSEAMCRVGSYIEHRQPIMPSHAGEIWRAMWDAA